MELSIIIVNWNTAQITLKCIKTIHKYLDKKIKYEIIVVDNNSSDDTQTIITNEVKQSHWDNTKLIKNPENSGFAKGNNIGVKQAKGKYLLFLNSDMELIDDTLLEMFNFHKTNNCGLTGPKFLNIDLTPQGSVFPPQTPINAFKEFFLKQETYSKYVPNTTKPIPVWCISGGCVLISQELFKTIGGWNEKYFIYFEDLDLCRSVRKLHKSIYFYPKCKVIHRHGASGVKLATSQNQWRRLIPSSIKYHGYLKHYFINFIIYFGQKWQKLNEIKKHF